MMPIATVGAIIEKDGRILLTKRNVEPYKGRWVVPGGHIEPNETAINAVRREIKEETGLSIKPEFLFYQDEICTDLRPKFDIHHVCLIFYSKTKGKVKINEESTEFRWFKPREALKLKLAFRYNEVIRKWLNMKS
jgi:8-oxo-dGTP diphosphatase